MYMNPPAVKGNTQSVDSVLIPPAVRERRVPHMAPIAVVN